LKQDVVQHLNTPLFKNMSVLNMPTVSTQVVQEVPEIRVVVVQGSALIVSDVNRKDAVVIVGLYKASVIT